MKIYVFHFDVTKYKMIDDILTFSKHHKRKEEKCCREERDSCRPHGEQTSKSCKKEKNTYVNRNGLYHQHYYYYYFISFELCMDHISS